MCVSVVALNCAVRALDVFSLSQTVQQDRVQDRDVLDCLDGLEHLGHITCLAVIPFVFQR